MSIAEMIMQGGNQQSKSWSVLSKNLGDLGKQVTDQLVLREYQKQAATALPAMQAAYRSAMDDVATGEVARGYQKFIDAQLQFGTSQNPLISGQAQLIGGNFTDFVATLEKQKQRQAQYGEGAQMPQDLMPYFEDEISNPDMPSELNAVEVPLPQNIPTPSAIAIPPQDEEIALPPVGGRIQPTPIQQNAKKAAEKYFALSPARQQQFDKETTYTIEELKDDYDISPVAGLGRFIPGAVGVGVPKPKERKEKSISISNQGRQTLNIRKEYLDDATKKAKEFAINLADKVTQVESDPEAMRLITDAGGINKVATKSKNDRFILQRIDGAGTPIQIGQETFEAIDTIKGSRAVGASAFTPIVVGRYEFNSVEEAEASDLPIGTIVYIGGRKAKIE